MYRLIRPMFLAALLFSCLSVRADESIVQELIELFTGDYFSAADGGVKEGRPIYMRVRPIQSPFDNRIALYAEMRHDGPSGELYRQRAYLFDHDAQLPIVMRALVFDDPVAATGLSDNPTLWIDEKLTTRVALAEGCDTRWVRDGEGFLGSVDPKTCVITGKRGDRRHIESQTRIATQAIGQLERGYDTDGRLLFGNANGELYVWPRVR